VQWHFDAAAVRARVDQNHRAWLAWHSATLSNMRRPPPLSRLMQDPETGARGAAHRPAQTPEQQIAVARRLNALFGGTVERRPSPE